MRGTEREDKGGLETSEGKRKRKWKPDSFWYTVHVIIYLRTTGRPTGVYKDSWRNRHVEAVCQCCIRVSVCTHKLALPLFHHLSEIHTHTHVSTYIIMYIQKWQILYSIIKYSLMCVSCPCQCLISSTRLYANFKLFYTTRILILKCC